VWFTDRSGPQLGEDSVCLAFTRPINKIFDYFDILFRLRKDRTKFFIGRLKNAESGIYGPVDDLNIFHKDAYTASLAIPNLSSASSTVFATSTISRFFAFNMPCSTQWSKNSSIRS